jgi:hypothetical protein
MAGPVQFKTGPLAGQIYPSVRQARNASTYYHKTGNVPSPANLSQIRGAYGRASRVRSVTRTVNITKGRQQFIDNMWVRARDYNQMPAGVFFADNGDNTFTDMSDGSTLYKGRGSRKHLPPVPEPKIVVPFGQHQNIGLRMVADYVNTSDSLWYQLLDRAKAEQWSDRPGSALNEIFRLSGYRTGEADATFYRSLMALKLMGPVRNNTGFRKRHEDILETERRKGYDVGHRRTRKRTG